MRTLRRTDAFGFSVVELIIVIALISILASMTFQMTGILAGRRAHAAAEKLSQMIGRTKGSTLAYSTGTAAHTGEDPDVKLTILRESDGVYARLKVRGETEDALLVTTDRVKIEVIYAGGRGESLAGAELRQMTNETVFVLAFDKRTGSLLPEEDGTYIKRIVFTEDDRVYTIRLIPATGMYDVESSLLTETE